MGLYKDLHSLGIYRGYEKHVLGLDPVLSKMSDRGMPVSHAGYKVCVDTIQAQQDAEYEKMQAAVPPALLNIHPKQGYKKTPKDTTGMVERNFDGATRWCKLKPFVPSHDQLTRYMKHCKHAVPRNWKEDRETTAELELRRLAKQTGDPLYAAVLEYREAQTMLSNHLANWEPQADGRVHSTFYFDPATGQLSSRRPNVQNAPKHKAIASSFRRMVEARPGHRLLAFDYKSFHALTLGFEAQDADYMRMARLDIHAFFASHLVREPVDASLPDDELVSHLAYVKQKHRVVRDTQAKRAILGYAFGMKWRKLYDMNRDAFDTQKDARRVMDMLDALFPKAARWRREVQQEAHQNSYLRTLHGYIRWFFEVFRWNADRQAWGHGDDAEAAIALRPANDAFGHAKDCLLRLEQQFLLDKYGLINYIHDEFLFECPEALIEEAIHTVKREMEMPSDVLVDPDVAPTGLNVGVSVSMGQNWAEMKEVKL